MKRFFVVPVVSFLVLLLVSCDPEEIITPDDPKLAVTGVWTAGGTDIAPLLADTITEITMRFKADSTYIIEQTHTSGLSSSSSGTYSVNKSGGVNDVYPVSLFQTLPSAATLKGIFEINEVIEPEEMTFELVQTQPNIGFTPPTPENGFGSTNEGNLGTTNISRFQRVE